MKNENTNRSPGHRRRKVLRSVFLALGIVCAATLAVELWGYVSFLFALGSDSASVGIIGGVDGPTAIFVTSGSKPPVFAVGTVLLPIVGLLMAILGLFKTRK